MPFPQAPVGARWILGGWRWSNWLWCCGWSCWWCSRRMTKRSSPVGLGRGRREGQWEKGTKSSHSFWSQAWVSLDLWAGAESCCHTQGLPSRYTLVLTFKLTSKMWGGMSCTTISDLARWTFVSLSDMIEGSYRSWDLYITGQLVDGLQQKKKKKKKKRKPVFIKRKWNHVVFSWATILSFHPVLLCYTGKIEYLSMFLV